MATQKTTGGGYYFTPAQTTSQVDWSKVSGLLSKTLEEEGQARQDRIAGVEQEAREYGDTLQESMQSDDPNARQFALRFSNDAQEMMLINKRLLLNGEMSHREYTAKKQALVDGANGMTALVTTANEQFAEWQKRNENDESQGIESYWAKQLDGYTNFGNHEGGVNAFINPITNQVSLGKMVLNKKTNSLEMSKNQNDFASVQSMLFRNTAKYNSYDAIGAVKKYTDTMGKVVKGIMSSGIKTKEDVYMNSTYEDAIEGYINAEAGNPLHISGVVYDKIGVIRVDANGRYTNKVKGSTIKELEYTEDLAEAKTSDHYIYIKPDGKFPKPSFTSTEGGKAQRKLFDEFLEDTFRSQLDQIVDTYIEPVRATQEGKTGPQLTREANVAEARSVVSNLIKIFSGTDAEKKEGAQALETIGGKEKFLGGDISDAGGFRFNKTKIVKDPETDLEQYEYNLKDRTFADKAGNPTTLRQFINASLSEFTDHASLINIDEAIKTLGGYDKDTEGNLTTERKYLAPTKNIKLSGQKVRRTMWENKAKKIGKYTLRKGDDPYTASLDGNTKQQEQDYVELVRGGTWNANDIGTDVSNKIMINVDAGGVLRQETPFPSYTVKVTSTNPIEKPHRQALKEVNKLLYSFYVANLNPTENTLNKALENLNIKLPEEDFQYYVKKSN